MEQSGHWGNLGRQIRCCGETPLKRKSEDLQEMQRAVKERPDHGNTAVAIIGICHGIFYALAEQHSKGETEEI